MARSPDEAHVAARPSVLLVDDDEDVRTALLKGLAAEGLSAIGASSADGALRVLAERPIDVVVTDEQMPTTLGSEFLIRVAATHPSIVRIVLTGQASLASALRAINQARAMRFLEKPIDATTLADIIRSEFAEATSKIRAPAAVDPEAPEQGVAARLGADAARLSAREQQVVELLATGAHVKDIARTLDISHHTVRNHVGAILQKLGLRSQLELMSRLLHPVTEGTQGE